MHYAKCHNGCAACPESQCCNHSGLELGEGTALHLRTGVAHAWIIIAHGHYMRGPPSITCTAVTGQAPERESEACAYIMRLHGHEMWRMQPLPALWDCLQGHSYAMQLVQLL